MNARQTRIFFNDYSRTQQGYEKRAVRIFYAAIRDQINQFVSAAKGMPDPLKPNAVNSISAAALQNAFNRVYRFAGAQYAAISYQHQEQEELSGKWYVSGMQVKADPPGRGAMGYSKEWQQLITEYLRIYGARKVTRITETTRQWIREQLIKGQEQGLNFQQISKLLISDGINASRALKIARTETVAAMNLGRYLAADKSNFVKEKTWISAHDSRVRPGTPPHGIFDHHASLIKKVDLHDAFIVSAEQLMFPGDTSHGASAGNVINCRCTFAVTSKRDAQGRLMVKPPSAVPQMSNPDSRNLARELALSALIYAGISVGQELGNVLSE